MNFFFISLFFGFTPDLHRNTSPLPSYATLSARKIAVWYTFGAGGVLGHRKKSRFFGPFRIAYSVPTHSAKPLAMEIWEDWALLCWQKLLWLPNSRLPNKKSCVVFFLFLGCSGAWVIQCLGPFSSFPPSAGTCPRSPPHAELSVGVSRLIPPPKRKQPQVKIPWFRQIQREVNKGKIRTHAPWLSNWPGIRIKLTSSD